MTGSLLAAVEKRLDAQDARHRAEIEELLKMRDARGLEELKKTMAGLNERLDRLEGRRDS